MPVGVLRIALAALLFVAPLELAARERQQPLIRSVKQLAKDADVKSYVQNYAVFSGANLIYAQCDKELEITEEQKKYLSDKFSTTSQQYIAAYINAYVSRIHAPPPKALGDDIVKTVAAEQQAAVNKMALVLRQRGCKGTQLRPILRYIEQLRQRDLAPPKPAPLSSY